MPYLVVLQFRSLANARNFVNAYPDINPQVTSANQSGIFVVSTPDSLDQMPQGDMFPVPPAMIGGASSGSRETAE